MLTSVQEADIRLLRMFAAVVEAGGFSAAQAVLRCNQSTISTRVAQLEARLGIRLCQRGRSGFRLTNKGKMIYDWSHGVFAAIEVFRRDVAALGDQLFGTLNIGVVEAIVTNPDIPLSTAIQRFFSRDARVTLSLHVMPPNELERAVLKGECHIGIAAFHRRLPGMKYEKIGMEQEKLYCGLGSPLFDRDPLSLSGSDVSAAPFVDYSPLKLRRRMAIPLIPVSYANSVEAIASMVLSGHFIGFLPTHYAANWVDTGRLRELFVQSMTYRSVFDMAYLRGAENPTVVDAFIADLRACLPAAQMKEKSRELPPSSHDGTARRRNGKRLKVNRVKPT